MLGWRTSYAAGSNAVSAAAVWYMCERAMLGWCIDCAAGILRPRTHGFIPCGSFARSSFCAMRVSQAEGPVILVFAGHRRNGNAVGV